jgi:dihydrofolate reductase
VRLVVNAFVSLDGVAQAPGGPDEDTEGGFAHGGWSAPFFDPGTMGAVIGAGMESTEALLFGRRTWQGMARAWPERAGDPYADRMNAVEKHVASRTLTQEDLTWSNSHLLPADDVLGAVRRLRERDGGDLRVWGSLQLVRALAGADLVDLWELMVEPVLLGGGKRLYPDDGRARTLELVEATTAATGVQICRYRPVRTSG